MKSEGFINIFLYGIAKVHYFFYISYFCHKFSVEKFINTYINITFVFHLKSRKQNFNFEV